jgi:hypothetical protein
MTDKDLTALTLDELRAEAVRTSRTYEEVLKIRTDQLRWEGGKERRRELEEKRAAKAAAEAQARRREDQQRQQAEAALPKFASDQEQLIGLGSTPAVPGIGTAAVNGPWVAAELALNDVWYQDQLADLRAKLTERLGPVADHLGWGVGHLVTRVMAGKMDSVRNEAAVSQGTSFLVVKGITKQDWSSGFAKLAKGVLGWIPESVNRTRSRRKG